MATPMNNTGNAVGSTDPRDLVDNAQVLDKLMLSAALSVPDRLGNDRLSWAGIGADNDARIGQAINNLVPLGKQYFTLPSAQADIASGVIPASAYFYVRSAEAIGIALEYQNQSGTAVPTGKLFPSQAYVDTVAWAAVAGAFPVTRNLFNKDSVQDNYALSVNGVPYPQANYFATDFIAVKASTQYTLNNNSGVVVFFSASKVKISNTTASAGVAFTTPANTLYVRFQILVLAVKNTLMLVEGASVPATYIGFGFPTQTYVDTQALTVARSVALSLQKSTINIFNSELATKDYALTYTTGGIYEATGWFVTPVMMVNPGGSFVASYATSAVVFYKIDGTYLSGSNTIGLTANTPIAVPASAYFVRFHISGLARLASLMVSLGSAVPPGYIPFGGQTATLPWQGMGLGVLGDSISATGNYIPKLLALTGMILRQNYGVPGQGVRTMANSVTAGSIANMDFISILGGTNDYGGNRRLGSIADARADYDESSLKSFYFDVFYVLNALYTLKPTIRVMFSTPLKRGAFESQPVYPAANSAGFTLPQYVQAIKEVCSLFSVPVCDLFSESGINLLNLTTYTGDNLHPNLAGGELMARRMASHVNLF